MKPFRVDVPQSRLDDLDRRLANTRWPAEPEGTGWADGVPVAYLKDLVEHWRTRYDWRHWEARLNAHPQFTTTIDGANVHFLHVRSAKENALPLLITHGWPGSVVEFLDVVEPLSRDFHLVIPSMPNFGFSGPTDDTGWTTDRIAAAWAVLMAELGYDRYGVQGGDWGASISRTLGVVDAEHVVGVHVNFLLARPPADRSGFSEDDRARLAKLDDFRAEGTGYQAIQGTRPQTLAYALTDSPVGQLAWIIEKFKEWTDSDELPEDAVDRDRLLTNVMVYWLTATGGSSARIYKESPRAFTEPSSTPTAVAVFPAEIARSVRSLVDKTNNIVRWTEFDRGGHFAALEEPDLFAEDVRAFFLGL
ncbi:MAG TPA: epoxide hydrolase [Umezawaea sp.]|nr:epoxide hydrolase [Umezawaea sp.]